MFAFFDTVNHLSGPLKKEKFTSVNEFKGHGLWYVIGGFWPILWVFLFEGLIDGSEKCDQQGKF